MSLRQAAPGEGPKKDRDHFRHWSVKGGETHHAYIAGPCQWYVCHPSSRTKPCLHWITDGDVCCPRCAQCKPTALVGYLPVYRQVDWAPLLVVLYETEREWVSQYETHDRVTVGREKNVGAGIWVRRALAQAPIFVTTLPRRQNAQDITDVLLTIWGLPELTAWYRAHQKASDNAVSLAPATQPDGGETRPVQEAPPAARPYTPPDPLDIGEAIDVVANRIKGKVKLYGEKPSKNGKHDG